MQTITHLPQIFPLIGIGLVLAAAFVASVGR